MDWNFTSLILIPSTLSFIFLILYYKYKFLYWKKKNISTIPPSIPFGNIGNIILAKQSFGEILASIYNKLKLEGKDFGGMYIFAKPIFIAINPDLIRHIMIKDFSHFVERGTYFDEEVDPLSAHIFSIRNPKWHELRTKFSPMFTSLKLKDMFPIFKHCSEELTNALKIPSENGESVNIRDILQKFTTDMIASIAFGIKCNSLTDSSSELHKFGKNVLEPSFKNSLVFSLGLLAPKVLKFFKVPIVEPTNAKYFIDMIKYTVETREKNNIYRNDMMELLIKMKNNKPIEEGISLPTTITFNELAAQAFVFYLAGFESTSSTISFAIFELAKNNDLQEKLRCDILKVLEKYQGEITYDALNEMNFLERVIQESLRKYPILPVLSRECVKDYIIPGTNKVIEKGTSVVISALGMQMDPELFEDPHVFDPDRFSPDRGDAINPNAYLPFGIGPRSCIGSRQGKIQTKIGLVTLLRNYKFTLDPKKKIPFKLNPKALLLSFADTIWLKVYKI